MNDILERGAVAELLGVSTRTLARWIDSGELPPPRRLGRRAYWLRQELDTWLSQEPSRRAVSRKAPRLDVVRKGRPRMPV